MTNGYISLEALKAVLRDDRSLDDAAYERAIEAASRRIDTFTGQPGRPRQFWRTSAPEARLFRATTRFLVRVGDFADTTGMTVEVADPAGVFSPLAGAAWQPEPYERADGHPFTAITVTSSAITFPVSGRLPRVRVTARWGWEAVPKPVEQACQIFAIVYVKSRDLTAGVAGFEGETSRPADLTAQAEALLAAYHDETLSATPSISPTISSAPVVESAGG